MEKFKELYAQYDFNFTDDDVKKEVEKILSENYDKYNNVDTYKQCFNLIDLTSLNSWDTEEEIGAMMEKVNTFQEHYSDMPNVAAV